MALKSERQSRKPSDVAMTLGILCHEASFVSARMIILGLVSLGTCAYLGKATVLQNVHLPAPHSLELNSDCRPVQYSDE